ncbi:MAG: hypothetical protein ABEJ72_00080, partial [Candidatus Aenigmatarchaeota archaeon]
ERKFTYKFDREGTLKMKDDGERGFFTMDVMIAMMLLLTISVSLLQLSSAREETARATSAEMKAKLIAEKLAASVNSVYANGENVRLKVGIPDNLTSSFENYEIEKFNRDNRRIKITWGEQKYSAKAHVVSRQVEIRIENKSKPVFVYWENENVVVEN